jgi:methyl-accepting chemotaxis protein
MPAWIVYLIKHRRVGAFASLTIIVAADLLALTVLDHISANIGRTQQMVRVRSAVDSLSGLTIESRLMGAALEIGHSNEEIKAALRDPTNTVAADRAIERFRLYFDADDALATNMAGKIVLYQNRDPAVPNGKGRDISFRPYVQQALRGQENVYPAVGSNSRKRGLYYAAPIVGEAVRGAPVIGMIAIKIGMDRLDQALAKSTDRMALVSPQGVVMASNSTDWLFGVTAPLTPELRARVLANKQFGDTFTSTQPQELPFRLDQPMADIDGHHYAIATASLPWNDPDGNWQLVSLTDTADWVQPMARVSVFGGTSLIFALLLLWATTFVRNAARLAALSNVMTALAKGLLDTDVPNRNSSGGVGDMARAVEVLRRNSLAEQVLKREQDALANDLRSMARHVIDTIATIQTGTNEIAIGTNNLAIRTERQVESLRHILSGLEEISSSIQTNASVSAQAQELAVGSLANSRSGSDAVTAVVQAMTDIQQATSQAGEIIQVIDEISFQTKLLSLNAAVEAARAGDAGKGFAVVAQEVRMLADRSRQASQKIRDLIIASTSHVDRGVVLSGKAGDSLQLILQSVQTVADLMPEIARASSQQARKVLAVKQAMNDIDRAAQQNAELTIESASAIEAVAEQARDVAEQVAKFVN